ncbi:unnamed protein product [Urochloa humidicola]
MPGALETRAPAPARSRAEESRGGAAAGHRRAASNEPGKKTMELAPAKLCTPDPRLVMLRKRQREEMEALRGILRKAELLAGKNLGDGRAAPRRGKDGRFLAAEAEARPAPAAAEADRATSAKRRKTMMPLVKIAKPKPIRMSADEISNLASRVSSLSEDMPPRILEFLKKECSGHEDTNRGEIEIDIGSMRHPALFELRKMLDEFAEEENRRHEKEKSSKNSSRPTTSRSSSVQHEDGEIVEGQDCDVTVDTCSVASSVADKILCSNQEILEDGEIAEEGDVICSDAAPAVIEKFAESGNSPSSSSSSSSSSSESSSSSGCTSGGSCRDTSGSDSSDSDSDDESVTSSPAPAILPKANDSPMAVDLCSSPCLTEQVPRSSPRRSSSPCPLSENGEIEEECPPESEKIAEAVISPRDSYSSGFADDGSVSTVPAPVVLPEPLAQQPAARDRKLPLSQAEYRAMIAKAVQKHRRLQNPERQRAYEELEEKERKAKPISDWIQPMHLSQLGITPVEYAVTSERRVPGRGSPVQKLLGLFLKAE